MIGGERQDRARGWGAGSGGTAGSREGQCRQEQLRKRSCGGHEVGTFVEQKAGRGRACEGDGSVVVGAVAALVPLLWVRRQVTIRRTS